MRRSFCIALAALVSIATPLRAQAPATVLACDTLVNLRVLMGIGDRPAAEAALPSHPGCRRILRDRVGAAEHRAMVGGAPYECLTIAGEGACAWIWP